MREATTTATTNLANLLMGQIGKNTAASQKKIKASLLKATHLQAPVLDCGTKPKRRVGNKAQTAGAKVISDQTSKADRPELTQDNVSPQTSSFQAVLQKASLQSDGDKPAQARDAETIEAISSDSPKPAQANQPVRVHVVVPVAKSPKEIASVPQDDAEITETSNLPQQEAKTEQVQAGQQVTDRQVAVNATTAETDIPVEVPELAQRAQAVVSLAPQSPQAAQPKLQPDKTRAATVNSQSALPNSNLAQAATVVSEIPSLRLDSVVPGNTIKSVASVSAASVDVAAGAFQAAAAQAVVSADAAVVITATAAPSAMVDGRQVDSSLSGQIARAVASIGLTANGHQVVIQLNPPELGRVHLTLESRDDQIRGVLRVDDPGTLAQLRQETPGLLHRLSENGLDVRQLDIVSAGQASSQPHPFGQGQDGQAARQQQSSPWQDASSHTPHAPAFNEAGVAEDGQYVGNDSINTWV
jgi:flagellar hook-length control protein FliK